MESILSLTPEQKRHVEEEIGPLRSITEFCSGLLESTKELPLKEELVKLLPWAAKGGRILSEVTPLAKALVKLVDEVAKEKDPEILGVLACSLAYQRSAAIALTQLGEPRNRVPFEQSLQSAREDLKKINFNLSLNGFSLEVPLAHPFVWQADSSLSIVVRGVGYSESEWRQIQLRVHEQFRSDLVEILSHGETVARFEPFTKRLSLGDTSAAYATLNAHIERQRWLFEERPVLNIESFTLEEVYVDTDCGKLHWKDFAKDSKRPESGRRFDPFSEEFGGRHPLMETVLGYLRDPKFNDAIVIQGAPGSGKSSFTLRLANSLRREGLRPLRIRLKFLDLEKSLLDALARVVMQPEEGEDPALGRLPPCSDPFIKSSVFQEKTEFGSAEICPYVLILDGWDEISVAVNEGFEIEVSRMLDHLQSEFLNPRLVKVRVIVTGRPSQAVKPKRFLRDTTPILTMRDYTADQLQSFTDKIKIALEHNTTVASKSWPLDKWGNITRAIASYREDPAKLEILGLPLLAHLSLRLLAQSKDGPDSLLTDRTALYRHLMDLVCIKSGKSYSDGDDLSGQARIKGTELRRLLQQTALAITAYGQEGIPFRELLLRLKQDPKQAMEDAKVVGEENPLVNLMISFYFKGGREHLGCEFLHKSFHEYLCAEAIVSTLKEYGRAPSGTLAQRQPYWKDFQESDPRWRFSRDMSQILCPRPLAGQVATNVRHLLAWEIERSHGEQPQPENGQPADAITSEQWEIVRDSLVALWDWWGEGVHLRPQPLRDKSGNRIYQNALINELVDDALPRYRGMDAPDWSPIRLVNADANLGDGLCQLNAWVHSCIMRQSGWNGNAKGLEQSPRTDTRPYQTEYRNSRPAIVRFRPTGRSSTYFVNYCSRISAAGNRPGGAFPGPIDLRDIDLSETSLRGANLDGTILSSADLTKADLTGVTLSSVDLRQAEFHQAQLTGVNFFHVMLRQADFRGAELTGANLIHVMLRQADLSGAQLTGSNLIQVDLREADLSGARITNVTLNQVDLTQANLNGAIFVGVALSNVEGLTKEQPDSAIAGQHIQG